MEENNVIEETPNNADIYINEINQLKQNSVSKSEYDKILQERNSLVKAVMEGSASVEPSDVKTVSADISELSKNLLYSEKDLSNLEYCRRAVELHDAVLEQEGIHLGLPNGRDYVPTDNEIDICEKTWDALRDMVNDSQGDPEAFLQLEQFRIADSRPLRKK